MGVDERDGGKSGGDCDDHGNQDWASAKRGCAEFNAREKQMR